MPWTGWELVYIPTLSFRTIGSGLSKPSREDRDIYFSRLADELKTGWPGKLFEGLISPLVPGWIATGIRLRS
jgi:hypothetical protein